MATRQSWGFQPGEVTPGNVAQLSWCGQLVGRLVHVQRVVADLDWSAVSAAIDCDPYFSRDGHGRHEQCGGSAWHAVRIHNFCRPMGSPEACCERVGSLMHNIWDPHRAARGGTGLLMDEVVLQEAKVDCTGSARDEGLVQEIAKALWHTGYRPLITQRKRALREATGALRGAPSKAIARARLSGDDVDADRAWTFGAADSDGSQGSDSDGEWVGTPSWFPRVGMAAALDERRRAHAPAYSCEHVNRAIGRVAEGAPIPTIREHPGKPADRAGSDRREALRTWLRSEEGLAWTAKKNARQTQAGGFS